jgi:sec-independent protein translocase protein TatA
MGGFSAFHWLILIAVIALLFGGRGKISGIMGDVAHGIRNFREGLKDPNDQQRTIPDTRDTADIKKADEVKQS